MYRTVFWTLWEKARVGCFKRTASKHVYYLGWNWSPAQVGCMRHVQKLLSLLQYHLFCFYFHYSRRWIKKDTTVSECVLFSSMSLRASSLIVRSLIHFEFIFVYDVRKYSNFILLHVAVQFSQHHLLKRLSFPHGIFMPSLLKIRCQDIVHGFISGISLLFHWSLFLFCASAILFWWL